MLLKEAKEILKKNGYMLETTDAISNDDLIAFAKLNCSKALGAGVTVKERSEYPFAETDMYGETTIKKYNGPCITGYFKERTGAGARRGAAKYFSFFPEENKLVVGPSTTERVNGKLCKIITDEYTYNSWNDIIKFFNHNNFNTTKMPKTVQLESCRTLAENAYSDIELKSLEVKDGELYATFVIAADVEQYIKDYNIWPGDEFTSKVHFSDKGDPYVTGLNHSVYRWYFGDGDYRKIVAKARSLRR